ncbi:MAG: hypothetical protein WBA13_13085 [Microcoleaceae cyanobacterium]
MTPNPSIVKAVEKLDYRVTSGDVAAQAGMNVEVAQQQLLALASVAGGHLQVSEAGEIAFDFPKNFRAILRNKSWRLQWQEWWEKVWRILFYLIRISFGIVLIASIILIVVSISLLIIFLNSSQDNNNSGRGNSSRGGGGLIFLPRFWISPDLFWFFHWNSYSSPQRRRLSQKSRGSGNANQMNFFEAVFSFLFGDGNPNYDLEEKRWRTIATVIRNHDGAVVAEQIAPYLDDLGSSLSQENEDYMLPVLTRFNGRPEVSPDGQLVYHFPELQTTARQLENQSVSAYLKEQPWAFSYAGSGQLTLAGGLGVFNLIGAIVLGGYLQNPAVVAELSELGALIAFVDLIYPILLLYGIGFLVIPVIRYFWIKRRNSKVNSRNQQRQNRAIALNQAGETVQKKINYARQFTSKTIIDKKNLAYTTEQDLIEQELEQADKIDAEWQRRLNESKDF